MIMCELNFYRLLAPFLKPLCLFILTVLLPIIEDFIENHGGCCSLLFFFLTSMYLFYITQSGATHKYEKKIKI